MKGKRMKLFGIGLLGMALILGGCNGKKPAQTTGETAGGIDKIRVGMFADSTLSIDSTLAIDVGIAEGIFQKNGLEVEGVTFAAGINSIDAVSLGQLEIGFAADFAILNRIGGTQNSSLRIFTGTSQNLNTLSIYTADPAVQKPADLAGKSVVTILGTVFEYYYAQTFAAVGVPESQVKYLPVTSMIEGAALIQSGAAQGFYSAGRAVETLNTIPGIHTAGYLGDYVNATVNIAVTSEQFLKEHPQALEKYIKSMDEIYQFIQANPQRSAEIVYTAHGAPVAQTLGMLNLVNTTIDFDQDFYDAMENVLEWGKGRGIIRYPYELKDYVDLTALKAVFPGRGNFN